MAGVLRHRNCRGISFDHYSGSNFSKYTHLENCVGYSLIWIVFIGKKYGDFKTLNFSIVKNYMSELLFIFGIVFLVLTPEWFWTLPFAILMVITSVQFQKVKISLFVSSRRSDYILNFDLLVAQTPSRMVDWRLRLCTIWSNLKDSFNLGLSRQYKCRGNIHKLSLVCLRMGRTGWPNYFCAFLGFKYTHCPRDHRLRHSSRRLVNSWED